MSFCPPFLGRAPPHRDAKRQCQNRGRSLMMAKLSGEIALLFHFSKGMVIVYRTTLLVVSLAVLSLVMGCQGQQDATPEPKTPQSDASSTTAGSMVTQHAPEGEGTAEEGATHGTSKYVAPPGRPSSADEALAALLEGNQRFVNGKSIHPHESADYRASLANEQHPFATVLTCSDSRVTPVLIFDQGIGDLFVIRVAGNVVDEDIAGSIEYAVDHLEARLLVILGHENCGAVTAAYHAFIAHDLKKREPHEIESLLLHIEPAVRKVDQSKPMQEQIADGVEANVREATQALLRLPDVQQSQEKGLIKIVGAIYSVSTGAVRLLDM